MSKIEWTEKTWNPVRGCSMAKGSESGGCLNCYAARMAARALPGMRSPTTGEPFAILRPAGPRWTGKVELIEHMLDVPLRRKKPTTYFVNSMSDLFHESLPDEAIDQVFAVMALRPEHTFQVLTKRAGRMQKWAARTVMGARIHSAIGRIRGTGWGNGPEPPFPLPNVWLGVSVEDQQRADERIPHLLQTPAAVRFLSVEPLLGPVSFRWPAWEPFKGPGQVSDHLDGLRRLDWVIVGGESGPGARPMHPEWARSIRDQCVAAGVPFFFKQWGAYCDWDQLPEDSVRILDAAGTDPADGVPQLVGKKLAGALLDGREWKQMPDSARRQPSLLTPQCNVVQWSETV